jgi:hypothetical protein
LKNINYQRKELQEQTAGVKWFTLFWEVAVVQIHEHYEAVVNDIQAFFRGKVAGITLRTYMS